MHTLKTLKTTENSWGNHHLYHLSYPFFISSCSHSDVFHMIVVVIIVALCSLCSQATLWAQLSIASIRETSDVYTTTKKRNIKADIRLSFFWFVVIVVAVAVVSMLPTGKYTTTTIPVNHPHKRTNPSVPLPFYTLHGYIFCTTTLAGEYCSKIYRRGTSDIWKMSFVIVWKRRDFWFP